MTVGTTEGDFAKMGLVSLRLLAGESAQAERSLALGRAQFGHHAAKLSHAAGVAALADHLKQAGSAQTRILLQCLAQEVEVRIGEAVTLVGHGLRKRSVSSAARTVSAMKAEFGRNGTDFPMLGVKQMADASDLFIRNHAAPREKD